VAPLSLPKKILMTVNLMTVNNDTLKADLAGLLSLEKDVRSQIDTVRRKLMDNYVKNCPTFTFPTTTLLFWCYDNAMFVDRQGNVSVSTHISRTGSDRKESKAGSKYKILKSWKTSKKTKGTHYVLYDTRTQRVANYYG